MLLDTKTIIEAGVGAVGFAACLTGYIYTRKNIDGKELTKKRKRIKTLFFCFMLIFGWFLIGVVIAAFSGIEGKLAVNFEMFSERIDIFGFSIAKTTVTATGATFIIALLLLIFRFAVVPKFTQEEPKGFQNAVELCVEAMDNFTAGVVGKDAAKGLSPYMLSIALFMIGCACSELFGLRAPTSDLTCTLAMGLCTLVLINVYGIKKHGVLGRLKSMGGEIPAMRPVMIPLKAVSDISVPVSLGCRLFGNMLGGMLVMELLKGVLGGYASGLPAVAGLYFNLFHPAIQIYIFIILSLTFINEALE